MVGCLCCRQPWRFADQRYRRVSDQITDLHRADDEYGGFQRMPDRPLAQGASAELSPFAPRRAHRSSPPVRDRDNLSLNKSQGALPHTLDWKKNIAYFLTHVGVEEAIRCPGIWENLATLPPHGPPAFGGRTAAGRA